jgi:hypothetical protein
MLTRANDADGPARHGKNLPRAVPGRHLSPCTTRPFSNRALMGRALTGPVLGQGEKIIHTPRAVWLRVCLVQPWIPENLISEISCGKAAVS